MNYKDLLNDIKAKTLKPVYLLHGEEAYYIDKIAEYIETTILTEDEKPFNLSIFYGKDSNMQDIIDTCRRFPMFSNFQLVILREANQLKELKDARYQKELEKLELYLTNPVPSTILIICYKEGTLDKRKKYIS